MAKLPRTPRPPKSPAETRAIMRTLERQHPNADTELRFTNAYELLVATILSAQCTDERVNQVTPALFHRYPDAKALANASPEELEPQIQSTGFFRMKSKALVGMANAVTRKHAGEIPADMDQLTKLPGVGRKTANVVLGHALGVPGLPVDRHVLRVSNRIGIAKSEDPEVVERQLSAAMPKAEWTRTSDTLILHGRRICKPKPRCDECAAREACDYYRKVVSKAKARPTSRTGPTAARVNAARESRGRAASARSASVKSPRSVGEGESRPARPRATARVGSPDKR